MPTLYKRMSTIQIQAELESYSSRANSTSPTHHLPTPRSYTGGAPSPSSSTSPAAAGAYEDESRLSDATTERTENPAARTAACRAATSSGPSSCCAG